MPSTLVKEGLAEALQTTRTEWQNRQTIRNLHLQQLEEVKKGQETHRAQLDLFEKVKLLLQHSSDYAREQVKQNLEIVVTNALRSVFGSEFSFVIELSEGVNPTAEFYVQTEAKTDNGEVQKIRNIPQDARGGGVVDVISLALRIAILSMIKPRMQGPLVLDEPGKHVSEEYIMPMVLFLKSVGELLDRQIILVTHNMHLTESADLAYHVKLTGGRSDVQEVHRLDNEIV